MKFLIDNWMLISIALASGGMLVWPMVAGGMSAGALSASAAVQLINREKAVVIDVCEPGEFASGHVVGAKNVPLASWMKPLRATAPSSAARPRACR